MEIAHQTKAVLGSSNWPVTAAQNLLCPGRVDNGVMMLRYECHSDTIHSPKCASWDSLKLKRCLIGSQCSSIMCWVTWSRGQRPATRNITALRTCRKGQRSMMGVWPRLHYNSPILIVWMQRRIAVWSTDNSLKLTQLTNMKEAGCVRKYVHVQFAVKSGAKISYCRWCWITTDPSQRLSSSAFSLDKFAFHPNQITSVLSGLSCSCLEAHHSWIWSTHRSIFLRCRCTSIRRMCASSWISSAYR